METAYQIEHGDKYAELEQSDREAHRILLQDVQFTRNAILTIGLAVKQIASHCAIAEKDITSRLFGCMYWLDPSENLMLVLSLTEYGIDMFVEIPAEHWRFRGSLAKTQ